MKRKDWKTNNLKNGIYGKKLKFKNFFVKRNLYFLRKLFIRKNKYLFRKNLFFNYFFYKHFLLSYKVKKQNYFYNLSLKSNKNFLFFYPEFAASKNVFNKKTKLKKLIKNEKINFYFLSNKYKKKIGLSYFTEKNDQAFNLLKIIDTEENNDLIFLKDFIVLDSYLNNFNFHFNYNIYTLSSLEVYKIIILLYIYNVKKI